MIIFILIFIILFIEIAWKGGQKFKAVAFLKNFSYKLKHKILGLPLNLETCKENLLLFNESMNRFKIPFWLSEGTALGAVRDNSFIPWDDDVDVSFKYEYRESFLKNVLPILKQKGFHFDFDNNNGNFIGLSRKKEKLDIDIVQENGFCMATQTKNAGYTSDCNVLIPYLNNMRQIQFLGTIFTVPGDDYLEFLYSKNWKTPAKSKFTSKKIM